MQCVSRFSLAQSGFANRSVFVAVVCQVFFCAHVKKTNLLLGIWIKNMLNMHSQMTSLKALPFL